MGSHQPFPGNCYKRKTNIWLQCYQLYNKWTNICTLRVHAQKHFTEVRSLSKGRIPLQDIFGVVQSFSHVWLFVIPWTAAHQASPVLHRLPEFAQTHVFWVGHTIQPSHPLSPPSPPAPNLSHRHSLFQWVSFLHWVAKVFEFQGTNNIYYIMT